MCPELVDCACLWANTWASYCQLNIETALAKIKPFFPYFLMGMGRTTSKYFTLNSATFLLCFSVSEALHKGVIAHIKLHGAVFNHLSLEISEGARAPLQTALRMSHGS